MAKKANNTTGWCLIPPWISSRDDLSWNEKFLYGRILGLTDKEGYCYASNAWLGAELHIAQKTVSNMISKFVKKGIAKVVLVRSEDGEVRQRRVYPIHQIMDTPPLDNGYPSPLDNGVVVIENKSNREEYIPSFEGIRAFSQEKEPSPAQEILEHWNTKSIVTHRSLTDKITRSVNGRLRDKYSVDEIKQAIDNYANILNDSSYFFKYKWTLQDFLQRGFEKFIDLQTAMDNYAREKDINPYKDLDKNREYTLKNGNWLVYFDKWTELTPQEYHALCRKRGEYVDEYVYNDKGQVDEEATRAKFAAEQLIVIQAPPQPPPKFDESDPFWNF